MGLSPYAMDLNLEKTTRQTTRQTTTQTTNFSRTGEAIIYDATVPNFALDDLHRNNFITSNTEIPIADRLVVANGAVADAIYLCREGAVPVVTIGDVHTSNPPPDTISLSSYDETTDITDSLSQLLTNTPPTAIGA